MKELTFEEKNNFLDWIIRSYENGWKDGICRKFLTYFQYALDSTNFPELSKEANIVRKRKGNKTGIQYKRYFRSRINLLKRVRSHIKQ